MTTTLLAYPGGAAQQAALIASLEAHRAADRIVAGRYWRDGKGCSVGCALESLGEIAAAKKGDHALLGKITGYGEMLQQLNDSIFERLPKPQRQDWPIRFAAAAKPGADLSLVPWLFLDRMLTRAFARLPDDSPVHAACAPARAVVAAKAKGKLVSIDAPAYTAAYAADAADAAADAAYAYAAYAAADAADAAYAARAAAYAARAAYAAAYAAAAAIVAASAAYAETLTQADDLCEIIAAAPAASL